MGRKDGRELVEAGRKTMARVLMVGLPTETGRRPGFTGISSSECSRCGCGVWISKAAIELTTDPNYRVVCTECARGLMRKRRRTSLERGPRHIQTLGKWANAKKRTSTPRLGQKVVAFNAQRTDADRLDLLEALHG